MTRSLMAGMTNYSIQSMDDMENDILQWIANLQETKKFYDETIGKLRQTGYWAKVDFDFKQLCHDAYKLFDTATKDLQEVLVAINTGIEKYHVSLIRNLGKLGSEYDDLFGRVWHENYENKDYGNKDFALVEDIYGNGRDMVIDMIDLSNLAVRMKDFIGKGVNRNMTSSVVNNNFNGVVSNFQQNYDNSTGAQNINYTCTDDLKGIINQIKDVVKLLPESEKQEMNDYVDDLEEVLEQDSPKKSKIKSFATSITSLFSKVLTMKAIENASELSSKIPQIVENIKKVIS